MQSKVLKQASVLWDYMSQFKEEYKSDALVICCSYDLRVCDYACNLIQQGLSDTLVISGNTGNWTRYIWDEPEALVFQKRALANGLNTHQIILEQAATNFGENINFSSKLLPKAKHITFITKPNSLLRVLLTAKVQCPDKRVSVTAPEIAFPNEVSNVVGVLGLINEMVGDIERIMKYPALGFQSEHELPPKVLEAWQFLLDAGFDEHLMK